MRCDAGLHVPEAWGRSRGHFRPCVSSWPPSASVRRFSPTRLQWYSSVLAYPIDPEAALLNSWPISCSRGFRADAACPSNGDPRRRQNNGCGRRNTPTAPERSTLCTCRSALPVSLSHDAEDVNSFVLSPPEFRVKQDVLPGRYTRVSGSNATQIGVFTICCALSFADRACAPWSARSPVMVPAPDFSQWLASQPHDERHRQGRSGAVRLAWLLGLPRGRLQDARAPALTASTGAPSISPDGSHPVMDDAFIRDMIPQPNAHVCPRLRCDHAELFRLGGATMSCLRLSAYIRSLGRLETEIVDDRARDS